jgi:4-amino-4-deoxy-L-arabinose transferase-like glycosyltransferase
VVSSATSASGATAPSAAVRPDRRFVIGVAGLVLLGAVIRVAYTVWIAPWPPRALTDELYYSLLPSLLAHGGGFTDPLQRILLGRMVVTAQHAPLYPLVLTGLYELGGTGQEAQRLLGSLFGAGTIIVLALLGRRVGGQRVGLVAAAIGALYPMLVTADGALMSESLYGFLIGCTLLAAFRLRDVAGNGRAALLGATAGLAALTRPEGALLLPLLLVPMVRRPGGVRTAAVSVLTLLVVLTPWTVRNALVFHRFVPISNDGGITIAGANCQQTYFGDQMGSWHPGLPCTKSYPGDEVAVSSHLEHDGLHYAEHHLGRLPLVILAREGREWSLFRPATDTGRSGSVETLGILVYYFLALGAIYGFILLRRRRVPTWFLTAPVVLVTVTAALTFGAARFREPAELSLVVLAAVAVEHLWRLVGTRGRRAIHSSAHAGS